MNAASDDDLTSIIKEISRSPPAGVIFLRVGHRRIENVHVDIMRNPIQLTKYTLFNIYQHVYNSCIRVFMKSSVASSILRLQKIQESKKFEKVVMGVARAGGAVAT